LVRMEPIQIDDKTAIGIEVVLPKTTLIAIRTDKGYIMCGALDVRLLNEKLSDRGIIAGRAVGVRSLDDLLNAPLESVTHAAEQLGIVPGMIGKEALRKMF